MLNTMGNKILKFGLPYEMESTGEIIHKFKFKDKKGGK